MARSEVIGLDDVLKAFNDIEKIPAKSLTKSVKSGATIALASARFFAPEKDGILKKGLKLKLEKSPKGKKVYQVTFDEKYNKEFVKLSKSNKRYYYPASQEYGFLTKSGKHIPGYRYLKKGLETNATSVENKILNSIMDEIDKIIK